MEFQGGEGGHGSCLMPNVEVNRRAEGTSELNRRLGAGVKGAAALERCGIAGDYGWGLAGKQAQSACAAPKWQSSRRALPEREGLKRQKSIRSCGM